MSLTSVSYTHLQAIDAAFTYGFTCNGKRIKKKEFITWQQRIIHSNTDLSDVNIARIKPLNQTEPVSYTHLHPSL